MAKDITPYSTAREMLAALAARRISARELYELHEARITRHNPALNVIVERDLELTRQLLETADELRKSSKGGVLCGLPITLKESMNVRGMRTTVGMPMWANFRSEHDGAIAERTRAQGAVLLGKTNVAPMLADWQCNNPIYGRTNNPWDLGRTPGGSSGGAAAVAAGLTPLDYGSDIGGSIRVPAAFCGVYGHRPSETALPRSGQFPFPPQPNSAMVMAVQGPLARSADDLELAFDAVSGPDVGEDVAWQLHIPPARHASLREFRVAVLPSVPWVDVEQEIRDCEERLLDRLGKLGGKVGRAQPELLGDHRESYSLYQTLLTAVNSANSPPEIRRMRLELLRGRNDITSRAQIRALDSNAGDYLVWHIARERIRRSFREFFREWDVLITPAFYSLAYPHFDNPFPPDPRKATMLAIDGREVSYELGLFYPAIATLPGQPATAFPVELSRGGLPMGLSAIGPYLEDRTPLRFASLYANEFGGFTPPPRFA